jgi:cytochrome c
MRLRLALIGLLPCAAALVTSAVAQLSGHGGPVRALAVSADGATLLSGGFDSSAIRWSLQRDVAEQVLRLHDSAVNAVAILADGRAVTAGADARIAVWQAGEPMPAMILDGHTGPVAALAASPDGARLASASWDGTIRLWPLAGGAPSVLRGHQQNVNSVAFTADGEALVSVGYDATVRIWPLRGGGAPQIVTLPTPLNTLAVAPDGEIAVAGGDGRIVFLAPDGSERGQVAASSGPITSLAIAGDGNRIAAAGANGSLALVDRKPRSLALALLDSAQPIWAVAFLPDGQTLLSGGGDRIIHRWDVATGQLRDYSARGIPKDPLAEFAGDPGAQVFRACIACHALRPDEGNRAGPNLHGLFGRRIATLTGYNFSPALKRLDIVWTAETVARLFELGPAAYTPGTKMPEQLISRQEDRDALVRFLERATR